MHKIDPKYNKKGLMSVLIRVRISGRKVVCRHNEKTHHSKTYTQNQISSISTLRS